MPGKAGSRVSLSSIPTWYAGYLFRSKTEARWCVFLDELGVKWDYEIQGFDADGTWYLPDLVIFPALGTLWAEIKGAWDSDPAGIARWRKFATWRPQPSRAVLMVGTPAPRAPVMVIGGDEGQPYGSWEDVHEWRPCPSGHHFDLCYAGTFRSKHAEDGCEPCANDGEERIERAVRKARSYRFARPPAPEA